MTFFIHRCSFYRERHAIERINCFESKSRSLSTANSFINSVKLFVLNQRLLRRRLYFRARSTKSKSRVRRLRKTYQGSCASPDPLAGLNTALWECSDLECVSRVSRKPVQGFSIFNLTFRTALLSIWN